MEDSGGFSIDNRKVSTRKKHVILKFENGRFLSQSNSSSKLLMKVTILSRFCCMGNSFSCLAHDGKIIFEKSFHLFSISKMCLYFQEVSSCDLRFVTSWPSNYVRRIIIIDRIIHSNTYSLYRDAIETDIGIWWEKVCRCRLY